MGYSRIPVYEGSKDNIIGILRARDLIIVNPSGIEETQVLKLKHLGGILIQDLPVIDEHDKLEDILDEF